VLAFQHKNSPLHAKANTLIWIWAYSQETLIRRPKSRCGAEICVALADALVQPYRTIVLISASVCGSAKSWSCGGRTSTSKRSVVLIQRSSVGKRLNRLKTEYSQDEVPIERGFILELKKRQTLSLDSEGDWLFPSPVTGRPYHADSIRAECLVPAGLQIGTWQDRIPHVPPHIPCVLDETGTP
jgi:integrase